MANDTTEVKAIARFIRISAYKVRRVLDQIRGRSYREALIILEFMPYRATEPILKVLRSAAANAEHNAGLDRTQLVITQAYADQGPPSTSDYSGLCRSRAAIEAVPAKGARSSLPNSQADVSYYCGCCCCSRKISTFTRINCVK